MVEVSDLEEKIKTPDGRYYAIGEVLYNIYECLGDEWIVEAYKAHEDGFAYAKYLLDQKHSPDDYIQWKDIEHHKLIYEQDFSKMYPIKWSGIYDYVVNDLESSCSWDEYWISYETLNDVDKFRHKYGLGDDRVSDEAIKEWCKEWREELDLKLINIKTATLLLYCLKSKPDKRVLAMRSLDDWVLREVEREKKDIKLSDCLVIATVETDVAEAVKKNLRQMVWENSFSFNS